MTAVKERPWGMILLDSDATEEDLLKAWQESAGEFEDAEVIPVTPRDISNLGGERKIAIVVVAFKGVPTKLHYQMAQYVEKHHPLVKYTAEAREALGVGQ